MDGKPETQDYLALPVTGRGPGVLVLHAWWGLTATVRDVCDRLAALGYVALAPDLYHGRVATTIAEAEQLAQGLQAEGAAAQTDVLAALDRLEREAEPGRVLGAIGFSLGASFATLVSGLAPERVRAVVLFYGAGEGDFERARAAYLGHFVKGDPYEEERWVTWMEGAMRSAGRPVQLHWYERVNHWFFEPDRPDAYDEAAATLAWERTVAFLDAHLRG
jgi:carboxymethylenebutenolidase